MSNFVVKGNTNIGEEVIIPVMREKFIRELHSPHPEVTEAIARIVKENITSCSAIASASIALVDSQNF
jgi:hypothetical protein